MVAAFGTVPSEVLFPVYAARRRAHRPSVVFVDADNKVLATGSDPAETVPGSGLLRGDLAAR